MLRRVGGASPRKVIALWVAAIGLLAVLGVGVEERLHRGDLTVSGTGSAEARELSERHFGESPSLVVLLEGPRRELDREGRTLAQRLDRRPHVAVLGPWTSGAGETLRPKPGRALILVRTDLPYQEASEDIAPFVRTQARAVREPVRGYVTGYPDIGNGMHTYSIRALERAELIAAPLLLIVLLLVFRSPIAAALPLVLGFTTIAAGRGVLSLVNNVVELDVIALNMVSMMGLALGVDYSLVLVSRFREELAAGRDPRDAVQASLGTAGRTIVFAGLAIVAAMIGATLTAPGNILSSSGVGTIAAAVLSVVAAVSVLPALLVALGPRIDRWSFGRAAGQRSGWGGAALRAIGRPAIAAAAVVVLLLALAWPAMALDVGAPDPRNLPANAPQRQDYVKLQDSLGPGWAAPYEITIASDREPITERRTLRRLDRFQDQLARDRDVLAVMGPSAIAERTAPLDGMERSLADAGKQFARARRDQERLAGGLARVDGGVAQVREGMRTAADGAAQLDAGAGSAGAGAQQLQAGLATADAGAARMLAGLREAGTGAGALVSGARRLSAGTRRLERGLRTARTQTREALPRVRELRAGLERGASGLQALREPATRAQQELAKALAALDAMPPTSKLDDSYRRAYESVATASAAVTGRHPQTGAPIREGYDGLDQELGGASTELGRAASGVGELERGLGTLATGLGRLERGAGELRSGIGRLSSGVDRLRAGLARLRSGGGELAGGLGRLSAGAGELAAGAWRLSTGAQQLSGGLASGVDRSGALSDGVQRLRSGVAAGRARTNRLGAALGGESPTSQSAIFDSGYLTLAALDGAPPPQRTAAGFAVNVDGGGTATRVVVIPSGTELRAEDPLRTRLEGAAARFAELNGLQSAVNGPAATLQDFDASASERLPLMALVLMVVTYLVLVPILRSLLLPALAVLLNVATVAAAFGVLAIGFTGDAPLGGVGHLDAISVLAIFGIVFGLSIDYEVFLLARMREGYALTGTSEGAIEYGLTRTAGVITGAALIMTGVFVAFATADIASMRQLGVGLTVAILLDATVVRLVLLPALIKLSGRAAWWLPRPLERLIPEVSVDGPAPATAGTAPLVPPEPEAAGNGKGNGCPLRRSREEEPAEA